MHRIVRLSLHNWYLVDAQDLDLRGHAAFVGESGVGKSSLLDGIQVAITGNHGGRLELNGSARSDASRSVVEYMFGYVSDVKGPDGSMEPLRRGAESTLMLTARSDETGEEVSFGVMLNAAFGDRREKTRRIVVRGAGFRIADYVERGQDGIERVMTHERMLARLRSVHGRRVTLHATNEAYVEDMLSSMNPRIESGRPFLGAFANTLRKKEFHDPTNFMRSFVLEARPLDLEGVQTSIAAWREMSAKVALIETQVADLSGFADRFVDGFRRAATVQTNRFLLGHLDGLLAQGELDRLRAERDSAQERSDTAAGLVRNHEIALDALREERSGYQTTLNSSDSAGRIGTIDANIALQGERFGAAQREIRGGIAVLARLSELRSARDYLAARFEDGLDAADGLRRLSSSNTGTAIPPEALETLRGIATRALRLLEAEESLQAQYDDVAGEIARSEPRLAELRQEASEARRSGSSLPGPVRNLMAILRDAGIESTPVSSVVDVTDPEWAPAIEGVLGVNATALMVEQGSLDRAHGLMRAHRADVPHTALVDRHALERRVSQVRRGSLAELVTTDDPVARAFLDSKLGWIVAAETGADLARHENAVMRNGQRSGGATRTVSFREERNLVLGRASQARSLQAVEDERNRLDVRLQGLRMKRSVIGGAMDRLAAVRDFPLDRMEEEVGRAEEARLQAAGLRRQRDAAEHSDDAGIRSEIGRVEEDIRAYGEELKEARSDFMKLSGTLGGLAERIATAERKVAGFGEVSARHRAEQEGDDMRRIVAAASLEVHAIPHALDRLQNRIATESAKGASVHDVVTLARQEAQRAVKLEEGNDVSVSKLIMRVSGLLNAKLLEWGDAKRFPDDSTDTLPGGLLRWEWVSSRVSRLRDSELLKHRAVQADARRRMEVALKEGLVTRLGNAFGDMELQLRDLNGALGKHVFVGQRLRFTSSLDPAMRPMYDLVRRVMENPEHDVFGIREGSPLDREITEGLKQVEGLISGEGGDPERLGDYRNYFTFEMSMRPAASTAENARAEGFSEIAGKLSGGQGEAPFYAAIAASMSRIYHPSSRRTGGTPEGVGLVLFDEAFARLDVRNTQELLRLYRELGLQVFVASPEDKRLTLMEVMDTVVEVSRTQNTRDFCAEPVFIGPAARAAMTTANPEHRGVDAFRTGIADAA